MYLYHFFICVEIFRVNTKLIQRNSKMNFNSTNQFKNVQNNTFNLTELYQVKLDQTQITVFGISSYFSVYLFICTLYYTIAKWKDKLRYDNIFCLLTTSASLLAFGLVLCRIVFWRHYFSMCPILQTSLFAQLTFSRCSTHLVYRSRYNSMHKSKKKRRKALFYTIYIIVASLLQLLVSYTTAFWFGNPRRCIFGMAKRTSVYAIIVLFVTILIVQAKILLTIIKPVLKHCRSLDRGNSDISNLRMVSILKRLFFSLFCFAMTDVLLAVSAFVFPRINTWLPVITIINMNINSICLIFSYADYKQRFMPLLKKKNLQKQVKVNTPVKNKAG